MLIAQSKPFHKLKHIFFTCMIMDAILWNLILFKLLFIRLSSSSLWNCIWLYLLFLFYHHFSTFCEILNPVSPETHICKSFQSSVCTQAGYFSMPSPHCLVHPLLYISPEVQFKLKIFKWNHYWKIHDNFFAYRMNYQKCTSFVKYNQPLVNHHSISSNVLIYCLNIIWE